MLLLLQPKRGKRRDQVKVNPVNVIVMATGGATDMLRSIGRPGENVKQGADTHTPPPPASSPAPTAQIQWEGRGRGGWGGAGLSCWPPVAQIGWQ